MLYLKVNKNITVQYCWFVYENPRFCLIECYLEKYIMKDLRQKDLYYLTVYLTTFRLYFYSTINIKNILLTFLLSSGVFLEFYVETLLLVHIKLVNDY